MKNQKKLSLFTNICREVRYIESGTYYGTIIDAVLIKENILMLKIKLDKDTIFVGFINSFFSYQPRDFVIDQIKLAGKDDAAILENMDVAFTVEDYQSNNETASSIKFIEVYDEEKYCEEDYAEEEYCED